MITKHITDITTRFNPFNAAGKTCRVFLAQLPANARQNMKINLKTLPRESAERSELKIRFKDGKEMDLDTEILKIRDVANEIDRHSRILNRQAALSGN